MSVKSNDSSLSLSLSLSVLLPTLSRRLLQIQFARAATKAHLELGELDALRSEEGAEAHLAAADAGAAAWLHGVVAAGPAPARGVSGRHEKAGALRRAAGALGALAASELLCRNDAAVHAGCVGKG